MLKVRWKRDVMYGAVLILFCVISLWYSKKIPDSFGMESAAQPGAYMRLWIYLLIVLAIIMIISALIKKPSDELNPIFSSMAVAGVVATLIFTITMPFLGYFLGSLLFLIVLTLLYSLKARKFHDDNGNYLPRRELIRKVISFVLLSLIVSLVSYYVFTEALDANLPRFDLW